MNEQAKSELLQWIENGEIQKAIDQLLKLNLNDSFREEVIALKSGCERLERKKRLGLLPAGQEKRATSQIVNSLIELISRREEQSHSSKQIARDQQEVSGSKWWKYMTAAAVFIGIMGSIAEVLNFINIFPDKNDQSLQLTVYVHGQEGEQHIILENTGELVVDFDNDRRTAMIGENGRTNFGEIPGKFNNREIGIGLETPGYEPVHPNKQYKINGKPIYLAVKKDDSLGKISGIVKNRDGSEFIKDALVMIGNDTTTTTNELGIFKMTLPSKMQVENEKSPYLLTVKKEGYQIKTEYYYPRSGDIEIRLEK